MANGTQLKYGMVKNESSGISVPMGMGASEVIAAASGRFVTNDGSGRLEIAGDGDTLLAGWVELPAHAYFSDSGIYTCSSTEGEDKATFHPASANLGVVHRIPINTGAPTTAATMRAKYGLTCDLSVASNIQGAQAGTSAEDTVLIVGGDEVGFAWLDVIYNVDKLASFSGVA